MGCGTSCAKYLQLIFNLLIAICGLAILGIGVAIRVNWEVLTGKFGGAGIAPWMYMATGGIMLTIALFGCCGVMRENQCMVLTYTIFLFVIIITQAGLGYAMYKQAQSAKADQIEAVERMHYGSNSSVNPSVDYIQGEYKCCGRYGAYDYGADGQLPNSCCSSESSVYYNGTCWRNNAFNYGCVDKINMVWRKRIVPFGVVSVVVACIELLAALLSICFFVGNRNRSLTV